MYPDKKQLELLIELQPIIKAKMGEWRIGDYGYINGKSNLCIYVYTRQGRKYIRLTNEDYLVDDERIIRIPLVIDPINPERGLCGMLDWRKWSFSWKEIAVIFDEYHNVIFTEDTMAPGMLKALCAQEGV
ncbi:MAG: hypothetical protein PHX21_13960 [bacterium]|jgi:hypothetical protein|nr:hypothetical protein [bacterium]